MGVKFGMEEGAEDRWGEIRHGGGTEGPSSVPNFTTIGATCRPCGAKNLKIGLGAN